MEKDKLQSQKKWNEMTKKEKVKNIGCLSIIAILVIAAISSLFPGGTGEDQYTIPGMEPAPTYLALEQMGFTTERNFGGEYGNVWNCTRQDFGISYKVEIYAPSASSDVQSFRLTIMVEPSIENIQKGKWMMKELAGVRYDTADPAAASAWVESNYDNDKASTIIGDAVFELSAPSEFARILIISKKPEEIQQ